MKAKKRSAVLGRAYLIVCLVVALFPIYWMINTSFKGDAEIYAKIPTLIPHARVCQVFCVSFKKKFYGEGSLPFCDILFFNELPC